MTDATDPDASADASDSPEKPVHLDDADDLAEFVAAHDRALVEFYTEGCPKCRALEPVLGIVARATDAAVGTCNPRDDPPLIADYDVRSVPLLLLFEDGELVDRTAEDVQETEDVVAFVESGGERA